MSDLPVVRLGLLGLGTVGQGVINLLEANGEEIARRLGKELKVVAASARDLNKQRDCNLDGIALHSTALDVVADENVDIVVELIGGETVAKEAVEAAIAANKSVVTANKALLALHGEALFSAADKAGVEIGYEASVAGGIPVIKAVREGLAGNQIDWLAGIINGTGNYILTAMASKGEDFADALSKAQELGYAEADPTFDVEGIDAAHKLTLLAANAFGMPLEFDAVVTEGVSAVESADIHYAKELGYRIKHLGIARRRENGVELRVHPTLLRKRELLARVDGVLNAVMVQGDQAGPTAYYGAGAGGGATASAVIADCVDLARRQGCPESAPAGLGFKTSTALAVLQQQDFLCAYYLRLQVEDKPGVLAKITGLLAEFDISIESIHQDEPDDASKPVTLVLLSNEVVESSMDKAQTEIESQSFVLGGVKRLRVEHFES